MDSESRRRAYFHPLVAFDCDGVALGLVGQKSWTRTAISKETAAEKSKKRRRTPIADKESYRWLEGLQMAKRTAQACPETTSVCVGDSEADIYDLFVAADVNETPNLHRLVRAGQNRNTIDQEDWEDRVRSSGKVGEQTVSICARQAKIRSVGCW